MREEKARGDVRAVGEADGEDRRGIEVVGLGGAHDEFGEPGGAVVEVVEVEDSLGEPAEEAGGAVLEHLAARAEERRIGIEHPAERDEIMLITAGAVEQEEGARRGRGARSLEAVVEAGEVDGLRNSTPGKPRSRAAIAAAPHYLSPMSRQPDSAARDDDRVRIDKWLWAARFFKTRSIAAEAVSGGKVELNGTRPKASKELRIGDTLRIRLGPFIHSVTVRALSDRRGPATVAAQLYDESEESIAARAALRAQHALAPTPQYDDRGRPTKKDRRALSAMEERQRRRH